MKYNCILIKYGELTLKGKNRKEFENKLLNNIQRKVNSKIKKIDGQVVLHLDESENLDEYIDILKQIPGLSSFSLAYVVENNTEDIEKSVLEMLKDKELLDKKKSFRVRSRRSNKSFYLTSSEINMKLGGLILRNSPDFNVNLSNPDITINIEVRDKTYIYIDKIRGAGGLPVGSSGRVLLLLSGGIDSPVAGYMAMKRGAELHCIHFHSPPFTSERAKNKVIDLAKILTKYGKRIVLHIVPFTEVQTEIRAKCDNSYMITIMRRIMLKISEIIANKNKALAIVTGESLGQVASQTLESMNAINEVTNIPVLRPLICQDKLDIINVAQSIGTYETSILPFEDCCTLFLPKNPKTRPNKEGVKKQEEHLDIDTLIQNVVNKIETIVLTDEPKEVSIL